MRKKGAALLLGLLLALSLGGGKQASADALASSAQAAALIEASSGRLLYSKNGEASLPMASTTKIMTAWLAIEKGDLDEIIEVPAQAAGTEGSSMYLKAGEKLSLRDLLYGLMLTSGNDAAVTIAIRYGGSVEGFAALMNERARELGCKNTHFVTPNGLHDPEHYTSAEDLAAITAGAMKEAFFRELVATTYRQTETGDQVRTLKNKNKILWNVEGGCGVKTGYTKAAGRCLVFAAEREGMLLIGVVLNCPNMWDDAEDLLTYGFDAYEMETLADGSALFGEISVSNSEKKALPLVLKTGILYPIRKDGSDAVTLSPQLPLGLTAPVQAGDTVGRLNVTVNGVIVGAVDVLAAESAEELDFRWFLKRALSSYLFGQEGTP